MNVALMIVLMVCGTVLAAGLFIGPVLYWSRQDQRDSQLIDAYLQMRRNKRDEVS